LPACKYCKYTTVVSGAEGKPRVYPDRATCRAIQIAEYEQLPAEAMEDPFMPPKDELTELCECLHCGPRGPVFEAVEMRWLSNEHMWACPCTTCGGRGYHFDIHPIHGRWECANCGHKWSPPDGNYKPSNCKCPKCGGTEASGMFDDEHSEEEIEAMSDEEYEECFGYTREEEEKRWREFNEKFEREQAEKRAAGIPVEEDKVAWEDSGEDSPEDFTKYDPEARAGEEDAEERLEGGEPPMPDDIDFPRDLPAPGSEGEGDPIKDDDIPW
jgi:hypothetical protein